MKITLLNPPPIGETLFIREGRCMQSVDAWAAIWPPLTLAILASIARKYGDVDLFDCNVEPGYDTTKTVERVTSFAPDVTVVNTSFPSIDSDNACALAIKKACPKTIVVGFGVFFTLLEQEAMQTCPGFDIGIYGEPEITFEEIMRLLRDGKPPRDLAGLLWREIGAISAGPRRPFVENLDMLPVAARDLLHNDRYVLPNNGHPFTLINVARGCPYPCIFCIAPVYYGRKVRCHSVEYIINELKTCVTQHGIRDFLFWEEIFTHDMEFGMMLCNAIIDAKLDISWATTTRADRLNAEILDAMKKSGCMLLGLGIETCNQQILDNVCKNESVGDIANAVALCKSRGMKTMGHFIFGLPGETPATAEETISYGLKLGLDYMQCYVAVPYPKTALGEMAREKGWIVSKRWADFDFGGHSVMNIGTIKPDEVDAARRTMFKRFYFRPSYVLKQTAALLAHPRQLLQASKFLNWMRTK